MLMRHVKPPDAWMRSIPNHMTPFLEIFKVNNLWRFFVW